MKADLIFDAICRVAIHRCCREIAVKRIGVLRYRRQIFSHKIVAYKIAENRSDGSSNNNMDCIYVFRSILATKKMADYINE